MSVFEYHNLLKNVTIKYEINPSKSLPLETEREKRGNVYKKFADNVFNKFSPNLTEKQLCQLGEYLNQLVQPYLDDKLNLDLNAVIKLKEDDTASLLGYLEEVTSQLQKYSLITKEKNSDFNQ